MRLSSCNDRHCLNIEGNIACQKNLQSKKERKEAEMRGFVWSLSILFHSKIYLIATKEKV